MHASYPVSKCKITRNITWFTTQWATTTIIIALLGCEGSECPHGLNPSADYPYDPFEPPDPYDPFPFFFCDINEDELGRPYYGAYDQYLLISSLIPSTPPPATPPPTTPPPTIPPPLPTGPPPSIVHPKTTTALPPKESYAEHPSRRTKRQTLTLPSCITSNECGPKRGMKTWCQRTS